MIIPFIIGFGVFWGSVLYVIAEGLGRLIVWFVKW